MYKWKDKDACRRYITNWKKRNSISANFRVIDTLARICHFLDSERYSEFLSIIYADAVK